MTDSRSDPRPLVVVSRRGVTRIRAGHPWVYRSDIISARASAGDLVRVATETDRVLGWASYSDASQIALRMIDAPGEALDERAWLAERLRRALSYRAGLGIDGTVGRLVSGEADGVPGLVVDRYGDVDGGDYLVLQTLTQATDRRLALITDLLVELVEPRGILARNDPKVRQLEGLAPSVAVVAGDVPERVTVRENGFQYRVDLHHGQKTGLFLDQRENHRVAASYTRGRALDAFTYQGGFALPMTAAASHVLALDSSAPAVAATRANAELNGCTNLEVREANVFDELRELEIAGEHFDTIVLDPPAFAKNRASVARALAGYKEINLRAIKLLNPGGHLITCSCSYNVDEGLFLGVLQDASADARTPMILVEKRLQARDHPVLIGVPETAYLKCLVMRKA